MHKTIKNLSATALLCLGLLAKADGGLKDDYVDMTPPKARSALHIACAGGISYGSAAILRAVDHDKRLSLEGVCSLGLGAGISAGIVKELFDKRMGYEVSKKDLLLDLSGSALGTSLYWLQEKIRKKAGNNKEKRAEIYIQPNGLRFAYNL